MLSSTVRVIFLFVLVCKFIQKFLQTKALNYSDISYPSFLFVEFYITSQKWNVLSRQTCKKVVNYHERQDFDSSSAHEFQTEREVCFSHSGTICQVIKKVSKTIELRMVSLSGKQNVSLQFYNLEECKTEIRSSYFLLFFNKIAHHRSCVFKKIILWSTWPADFNRNFKKQNERLCLLLFIRMYQQYYSLYSFTSVIIIIMLKILWISTLEQQLYITRTNHATNVFLTTHPINTIESIDLHKIYRNEKQTNLLDRN